MRKVIIAGISAVLLVGVASPAMAVDQFDLVCKAPKDTERFRVDLAKNEWCSGPCDNVQKIASVTSGMLSLHDHKPAFASDSRYHLRIDRVTGEWSWYNYNPKYKSLMDIKGICEPAPFSGITSPARKF